MKYELGLKNVTFLHSDNQPIGTEVLRNIDVSLQKDKQCCEATKLYCTRAPRRGEWA